MDIEIKGLELRYEENGPPLLAVGEMSVASGERILLRGASGSGKTSLLHALTGLMSPSAGEIHLGGRSLRALSESQRSALRRESIGFIFQRLNILEHLTAVENVQLGAPGRGLSRDASIEALQKVDMRAHADKQAWQLSLGEQQRVAIARVLATRPQLIVADEPTSSLDATNAERALDSLFEACTDAVTLIVATHDQRIVERFERRWTVSDGTLT